MSMHLSLSHFHRLIAVVLLCILGSATAAKQINSQASAQDRKLSAQQIEQIAGNAEVAEILRTRPGRGVMADDSLPTPPSLALQTFTLRTGLSIELVACEPEVSQPLFLSWDSAGRLWVVQYRQYQYPAGLKVVRLDQHLRAVFDTTPAAPPNHVCGADIISVLEDSDQDGVFDRQRNVIEGLNIATSVALGAGGIWVLNPPYLLFYPDKNQDCIPDGDPEVHLAGFGLQDTHSVANSLMFGPDGWLYGANGSTTSGAVVAKNTPVTEFDGQCIWRYHPQLQRFEIYAEGGGNTFSLEIDSVGRVFSGTNGGGTRGWYYPQGSYSEKNWGKHGPLTNPFAFGYLSPMKLEGDPRRFPQAFFIYEGGLLDETYRGSIIAPNSLHNLVWHSHRIPEGSTFRSIDQANLLQSSDRWFRPVYGGVGPDGAVYLADWYDTRLSHVSPVDDWHKESGRIYRIAPVRSGSATSVVLDGASEPADKLASQQQLLPTFDLTKLNCDALIACFTHPNKWVRQRAALELGWRKDSSCLPKLQKRAIEQHCLESLWAMEPLGGLTLELADQLLTSPNPHIRRWTVRLLGDRGQSSQAWVDLARQEKDIEVRSQLAASAKRLPTSEALPIIGELIARDEDLNDPAQPLMIWWALESHCNRFDEVLNMLRGGELWSRPIMEEFIIERLMQRFAASGSAADLDRCAKLLDVAPAEPSVRDRMISGMSRAFQGRTLPPQLPESISQAMDQYLASRGMQGQLLAARQGNADALKLALSWLQDPQADLDLRIESARLLGQLAVAEALEPLLALATGKRKCDPSLQRVAIQSLTSFDGLSIGQQLIAAFDSSISAEHELRATACRTLVARKSWSLLLLSSIQDWRVRKQDIPADVIVQLRSFEDPQVKTQVEKVFGPVKAIEASDQLAEIDRLTRLLKPVLELGLGDSKSEVHSLQSLASGEKIFVDRCGKCHQLFGKGENIGPKLDSYDRRNLQFWLNAIVAPSMEIREGYQTYQALTVDGRVLAGMIASQDLSSITFRSVDGSMVTIAKEQVEQMQAQSNSLMPEGLLKDLDQRQLEQLFLYLSAMP